MFMQRLRNDYPLALLTLFGSIFVIGVTPFAIYRFTIGSVLIGALEAAVIFCVLAGIAVAWRTGRTLGPTLFIAFVYTTACVAIAHLSGLPGLLWVYPQLVANFLLLGRRTAVATSMIAIAGVASSYAALPGAAAKTSFVASALIITFFAYVFASRAASHQRELESIAAHDPLTGAFNRRGLHAELEIAMANCARSGALTGMLMFDLDHFKRVNDTYGHEAGDDVLVQLARLVLASTRKGDRFYRLGGEEFGLLIPDTNLETVAMIAEKLRASVEAGVACGGKPITVSIGGTCLIPGETGSDLLARADAAMYMAKRNGRNRVVVHSDNVAAVAPGPTLQVDHLPIGVASPST